MLIMWQALFQGLCDLILTPQNPMSPGVYFHQLCYVTLPGTSAKFKLLLGKFR